MLGTWRAGAALFALIILGGFARSGKEFSTLEALEALPTVTVKRYHLPVGNLTEAKRYMHEFGPRDQFGMRRDAYTRWHLWWDWPIDESGRPQISKVTVYSEIEVTIPELAETVTFAREDLHPWNAYRRAVVAHEMGHVQKALQTKIEMQNAIRTAAQEGRVQSARDANAMAYRFLRKLRESDLQYDQSNNHGRSEGVWLP